MGYDRFVWWADEHPSIADVGIVCEDFIANAGKVEWSESGHRYFILLGSAYSRALRRSWPHGPHVLVPEPGVDVRAIEVFIYDDPDEQVPDRGVSVITRQADEFTTALALGLARVLARRWGGRLEAEHEETMPGGPTMAGIEREAVLCALKRHNGVAKAAAAELGLSVRLVQYRLADWGLTASGKPRPTKEAP